VGEREGDGLCSCLDGVSFLACVGDCVEEAVSCVSVSSYEVSISTSIARIVSFHLSPRLSPFERRLTCDLVFVCGVVFLDLYS
jgi:hypothetical protein